MSKIRIAGRDRTIYETRECPNHEGYLDYREDGQTRSVWWCGFATERDHDDKS